MKFYKLYLNKHLSVNLNYMLLLKPITKLVTGGQLAKVEATYCYVSSEHRCLFKYVACKSVY